MCAFDYISMCHYFSPGLGFAPVLLLVPCSVCLFKRCSIYLSHAKSCFSHLPRIFLEIFCPCFSFQRFNCWLLLQCTELIPYPQSHAIMRSNIKKWSILFAQGPFWNGGMGWVGGGGGGGGEDKVDIHAFFEWLSSLPLFHSSISCTLSFGATVSSFPIDVRKQITLARTGQTNSISSVRRNDGWRGFGRRGIQKRAW